LRGKKKRNGRRGEGKDEKDREEESSSSQSASSDESLSSSSPRQEKEGLVSEEEDCKKKETVDLPKPTQKGKKVEPGELNVIGKSNEQKRKGEKKRKESIRIRRRPGGDKNEKKRCFELKSQVGCFANVGFI
jgi:hypothetical protein